MPTENAAETAESPAIEYDAPPVAELEVDGTQYRVDAGFRGVIAVSGRTTGTWAWALLAEGKWDGVRLKAKPLDRMIVSRLEQALRAASEPSE